MKELAENCRVTCVKISLTKTEAAQQQLEGAINNFFLGNWACAITLAGAAESMLPPVEGKDDLFETAKSIGLNKLEIGESTAVTLINKERDWLKHLTTNSPSIMTLQQDDAILMILRAFTRLKANLDKSSIYMDTFVEWLESNTTIQSVSIQTNSSDMLSK